MRPRPFLVKTSLGDVAVRLRLRGRVWWYRFWLQGKPFDRSTKCAEPDAARDAAERAALTEAAAQTGALGRPGLADAVQLYLDARWPEADDTLGRSDVRKNNLTYRDHRYRLGAFAKSDPLLQFTVLPVAEATRRMQAYLNARAEGGATPQTVINDQRVFSRFCTWCMRKGAPWPWNPAGTDRLELDAVDRAHGEIPADADVEMVLAVLEAWRHRLYPVAVLVLSGMRRAGACRVRWSWIGKDRWIWPTKEKRARRWVPLSSWAYNRLVWWKAIAPPESTDAKLWTCHTDTASDDMRKLRDDLVRFKDRDGRALWPAWLDLAALRRHAQDRVDRARVDERSRSFLMNHSPAVAEAHYRKRGGGPEALAAADAAFNYGA